MIGSRAAFVAKRTAPRGSVARVVSRTVSRDANQVSTDLTRVQTAVVDKLVPWFVNNMPSSYFRQVDEVSQNGHLRTLSAHFNPDVGTFPKKAGRVVHESINAQGQEEITFMNFGGLKRGVLVEQVESLASHPGHLSRVKIYASEDNTLSFNIYTFDPEGFKAPDRGSISGSDETGINAILDYAREIEGLHSEGKKLPDNLKWSDSFSVGKLQEFMDLCSEKHVQYSRPRSFLHQTELYNKVRKTEDVAVHIERSFEDPSEEQYWIRTAETNVVPQVSLARLLRLLNHHNLDVNRIHLDVVTEGDHSTSMARVLVASGTGSLQGLEREIKRLKWADDHTLDVAYKFGAAQEVGLLNAEIITALQRLCQPVLAKINPFTFSQSNIDAVVTEDRHLRIANLIADAFTDRFNPRSPLSDEEFAGRLQMIRGRIGANVQDYVPSTVLRTMVDGLEASFRTNLYMENRYALSMRLDPRLFRPSDDLTTPWNDEELDRTSDWTVPYGVFFAHGRRFDGFHVRFRDIARGGLRLVSPNTVTQHAIEAGRHFNEAYDLAFGQQLKNKDIPEGGSKCVVLASVVDDQGKVLEEKRKNLVLRKAVHAFTDSLLDLIVDTDETRDLVVDFYGAPELLYLGPDEQVIPDDINWIVKRAGERQYPIPNAFMSSKPTQGINHKEFGVTSEGVLVFLDEALKHSGLDPLDPARKEPVTIKMTGGTGGDVAGNMVRLLKDAYGNKVSIVAMCDGSGSLEDPNGLDMDELLRLFNGTLDLEHFDVTKLSRDGKLHLAITEEGARERNTMHNRVVADAFIPAGGRPNTIDETNWENFLVNGEPSAKLIVEGANVFLTAAARKALFDAHRLPIVKDSSANKCGVICSSYEIMSSMLLEPEEFREHKEAIVADVLERLRDLARKEAQLMFQEFSTRPGSLPTFSQAISNAINRLTDAISVRLGETQVHLDENNTVVRKLIHDHLPNKLNELAGDRINERVPPEYIKCVVASALASKIVYREGILFIEEQDDHRLADIAFKYLETEAEVQRILEAMEVADWAGRDSAKAEAMKIVELGGIRALQK